MEKRNLLKNLKTELKTQNLSVKELAEIVGFSEMNIRNIFNEKQRLHLDFYLKACEALKVHPCKLLVDDYAIPDQPPEKAMEEKVIYQKIDVNNYVKREDFVFLQRQIDVLNQIIIKKL